MFFRTYSLVSARAALVISLVLALLGIYPAQAETIDAGWAQSLGSSLLDYGADLAMDGQENVYMAGFTTVGTGTRDIIVQKLNAGGDPAWSRTIGGASDDYGHAIAVDDAGNVYITGNFSQTVDFDPGVGITNLTSNGYADIFLVKLNSDGDLIWAKQLGGPNIDAGNGLIVKGGNLYLVGAFSDTADFDPGPGIQNFTSQGSTDIFITKLDSDGISAWTKTLGGASTDTSFDVALDEFGNVFTVGYFSESVDFDPGPGTSQRVSAGETDLFIHKLDPNGNFLWASQGAGTKQDAAIEVRLDGSGNAYVTGYFNDALYFDSGPGVIGAGANDIFVSKLDAAGNPMWIKAMGGTAFDSGYGIAVDRNGNVYATGEFDGTADFDPGVSVNNLTSAGSSDIFLSKLDADGEFIWAKRLGSDGYDTGEGIAVGSNDQLYLTGAYSNTVDFDPGIGVTNLTSVGSFDIFVSQLVITSQIYYVKQDATGSNTGTSWNDAFTDLQSALASASSGAEIRVAAGTYKPTSSTDRTISFVLKNGVAIYGGFAGTETLREQRDYQANVTTLSGDIGIAGDTSDNSYHVVIGSNTNNFALLDGFTVTGGNANQQQLDKGGGMLNILGSPTISNVIFMNNYGGLGGGMYSGGDGSFPPNPVGSNPVLTNVTFTGNSAIEGGGMEIMHYSSPSLTNVVFSNNTAVRSGGGLLNNSFNNPTLTNVLFSGNAATWGGGMGNWAYNSPILNNVTFSGNSAEWGGGMGNYGSSPVLTNVTFSGNTVTAYGGAISNENNSNPTLTNVTISGNSAANYGGGIYNDYNGGSIRNSILYGNSGGSIYNGGGSPVVNHSIVQGGYPGTGNIDADPLLAPLQDNGGFTQTMALLIGSPAINTGDDANCPDTDQRGIARPQGDHCDIGAYEYTGPFEDMVPPAVVSVTRADASPTLAAQVDFHITFSEDVTGVDVSDFSLTASGLSGAVVNGVSGSGNFYTVSVDRGSGAGTIRLDVVDDDSIADAASNPLGGVSAGNGDFNAGEFYTIPQLLTVNLNSVAVNDGGILESSESSNTGGSINATAGTFDVGDDKFNKQSLGVLHFDTSSLPDTAVITSVTLRVQRQGLTGTDPFTTHNNLLVDVQRPYFGTTAALAAADFQAVAGQSAISSFNPIPVNNWYNATVDSSGYAFIDLTGTTQFRLRFSLDDDNDRRADLIKFYSGEATTANRPQLIVEYYVASTTHMISGNVGVGGASLSYLDGEQKTVMTDGSGNYSLSILWTGGAESAVFVSKLSPGEPGRA